MKAHILLLSLALVACTPAYAGAEGRDPCETFFSALKTVPHDELTRMDGTHRSLWDGKKYAGCEIRFATNDRLLSGRRVPDFDATEGSEMYRRGWRLNNSFVADGPGTGFFAVEKESVFCLVRHEQPAYLGDHGNIIQSETLSITIQCRHR